MKKINITFSFRDETGDYSVKVFPFVIKCIVSVIVVFNFIVIAMALPGEISDHVKYSGKEYYKSCLLYTSPSPRDPKTSRMPSSA